MIVVETLFMLLAGHAVADFVLQPEAMGMGKNRNNSIHNSEQTLFPSWYYWLSAHSLVHGAFVFLITGNVVLGVLETALHWLTDFAKCENWISMHQDQIIHISCKFIYAVLIFLSMN